MAASRHPRTGPALLAAGLLALTVACSGGPAPPAPGEDGSGTPEATAADGASPTAASPSPAPPTRGPSPSPDVPEVPGGGESFFPATRLVGFSGHPSSPALGRMGEGDLTDRVAEVVELGEDYTAGDRRTVPVLELIATVVHAEPQDDDSYRTRISDEAIADHLAAARRVDGVLLLNIQPGRVPMLEEVQRFERWLAEPDVGLALDPEWAVAEDEVPGEVFGSTSGAELDEIAAWLSELTVAAGLPEKVLLYHQLRVDIVDDPDDLDAGAHERVVVVVSIDGIGSPGAKTATYRSIAETVPDGVRLGFKLFYAEDTEGSSRLMTPDEVMELEPRPEYVLYE